MSTTTAPQDEFDAQMQAIEQRRRAAIVSLAVAIATFIVLAFIAEFTLVEPVELGTFEFTKGLAYLLAPWLSMGVSGLVFARLRPKTESFLGDTSVIQTDGENLPRDLEAEEAAGIASGRKSLRAKLVAAATFFFTALAGYIGLGAYFDYRNALPRENAWEYVPRLRIETGEVFVIALVALLFAGLTYRLLAPKRVRTAATKVPLDGDTAELYGEVRKNSRKAQLAGLAGLSAGFVVAAATFYALVHMLEPRSAFDLRLLFGTMVAGVLCGGFVRGLLLPESMRAESGMDAAGLPPGSSDRLVRELGASYRLSRKSSLLDLVGLGSRAGANYELVGEGLAGFVQERGGAGALLLGSERAFEWIVSDAEVRVLQRVRRSRVPFVRTLVVEGTDRTLRLSKRWFSNRFVVRSSDAELADIRCLQTKDDMGLNVHQVEVTLHDSDAQLMVLAGVLAMDAL